MRINYSNIKNYVPIYDSSKMPYVREEDEGYYTIIPPRRIRVERKLINPTAGLILRLCDGNNTVEQISKQISQRYNDVSLDRIREDVANTLVHCWINSIISWDNNMNPFNKETTRVLANGETVSLAFDEDIKDILHFLDEPHPVLYQNKLCPEVIDLPLSLRYSLFSMNRSIVLHKADGVIIGLTSLAGFPPSTTAQIEYVLDSKDGFILTYPCIKELFSKYNVINATKIKAFTTTDQDLFGTILDSLEFEFRCTLKKECGPCDLNLYEDIL